MVPECFRTHTHTRAHLSSTTTTSTQQLGRWTYCHRTGSRSPGTRNRGCVFSHHKYKVSAAPRCILHSHLNFNTSNSIAASVTTSSTRTNTTPNESQCHHCLHTKQREKQSTKQQPAEANHAIRINAGSQPRPSPYTHPVIGCPSAQPPQPISPQLNACSTNGVSSIHDQPCVISFDSGSQESPSQTGVLALRLSSKSSKSPLPARVNK